MNVEAMEKAVREWHERMVDLETRLDALSESVGLNPEAPVPNAIWAVAGGYKDALDAAYHVGGWLEWWWLECYLGNSPKEAKLAGDKEERVIRTIDDLVALLRDEAYRERV